MEIGCLFFKLSIYYFGMILFETYYFWEFSIPTIYLFFTINLIFLIFLTIISIYNLYSFISFTRYIFYYNNMALNLQNLVSNDNNDLASIGL